MCLWVGVPGKATGRVTACGPEVRGVGDVPTQPDPGAGSVHSLLEIAQPLRIPGMTFLSETSPGPGCRPVRAAARVEKGCRPPSVPYSLTDSFTHQHMPLGTPRTARLSMRLAWELGGLSPCHWGVPLSCVDQEPEGPGP